MTCEQIDELAGAIALGAIPQDEWTAVRAHLATCAAAHTDLRQFISVATLLLESAPPADPPPTLRDRILAAARADLADGVPDANALDAPPMVKLADRRNARAGEPRPSAWQRSAWAAMAAALLLAAGMGMWNVSLRRDLTRSQRSVETNVRALDAVAAGRNVAFDSVQPGASGVVLRPDAGSALLILTGLPTVSNQTYQVWALRDGTPISLGVFQPDHNGRRVFEIRSDLGDVDAVAITLEPGPRGSTLPTTSPILSAPLQG